MPKALVLVAAAVLEAREKPSFHDLDGEPGELVRRDVLGGAGGLAHEELEIVARRDVDDGAADALHADARTRDRVSDVVLRRL
jgi:hypothetical protein